MRGVSRTAGSERVHILEDVNLSVPRGCVLNLVGPSGAGKSSVIRLVDRLDEADAGEIEVLGTPLPEWRVRDLRRHVGMVFQTPSLLGLSVRENLALPFRLAGDAPSDLDQRMARALEQAELPASFLERDEAGLSVGQKQRVALARSLIAGPELLLLDEPTSALDPRTAEQLLDSLLALNRSQGTTLILATHRLEEVRYIGGRMAVVLNGRIAAEGSVETVFDHTPGEEVAAFLHGSQATQNASPAAAPAEEGG